MKTYAVYTDAYVLNCDSNDEYEELNTIMVKESDHRAKIAELKEKLRNRKFHIVEEAIAMFKGQLAKAKTDAIREMLADVDIGHDSMYQEIEVIEVTDVIKYIYSLGKE